MAAKLEPEGASGQGGGSSKGRRVRARVENRGDVGYRTWRVPAGASGQGVLGLQGEARRSARRKPGRRRLRIGISGQDGPGFRWYALR